MDLSLWLWPSAVGLGALHALEPGHAKTLTAAFLIGIKGTRRDAILLGLSVAAAHSLVVVLLAATAVWLGREAFTDQAMHWVQVASGAVVAALGLYLLWRRWPRRRSPLHDHEHDHHSHHGHDHDHQEHTHATSDQATAACCGGEEWQDEHELAHARAHAAALPEYVQRGERPSLAQIVLFGAAGGLVPCPAAVSVMLLAISVDRAGNGLLLVLGFSLGLALTLVGIGLAVVSGVGALARSGRVGWLSRRAGLFSAAAVTISGLAALGIALAGGGAH